MTNTTASMAYSAEWLYDMLMKEIEPDLVSDRIQTLEKIYSHESEKERAERMKRYALAFEIFNAALSEVLEILKTDADGLGNDMTIAAREILKKNIQNHQ